MDDILNMLKWQLLYADTRYKIYSSTTSITKNYKAMTMSRVCVVYNTMYCRIDVPSTVCAMPDAFKFTGKYMWVLVTMVTGITWTIHETMWKVHSNWKDYYRYPISNSLQSQIHFEHVTYRSRSLLTHDPMIMLHDAPIVHSLFTSDT